MSREEHSKTFWVLNKDLSNNNNNIRIMAVFTKFILEAFLKKSDASWLRTKVATDRVYPSNPEPAEPVLDGLTPQQIQVALTRYNCDCSAWAKQASRATETRKDMATYILNRVDQTILTDLAKPEYLGADFESVYASDPISIFNAIEKMMLDLGTTSAAKALTERAKKDELIKFESQRQQRSTPLPDHHANFIESKNNLRQARSSSPALDLARRL